MTETRLCLYCHETRPVDRFFYPTGTQCIPCRQAKFREYYQANKAQLNEADRLKRRWQFRDRKKTHARNILADAVRKGKITKPADCERCNTPTPSRKLQGHHHSYDLPFDVEWLCTTCHGAEHSGANHWRAKKATAPTERISA